MLALSGIRLHSPNRSNADTLITYWFIFCRKESIMNKVRAYCVLPILLVLIGWGGSYAALVQAIGPVNEGLASSESELHPVDCIEAAKLAGEITPDEAALYKL